LEDGLQAVDIPSGFFRLFLKLVMGFAWDSKFNVTWRTIPMFSGALARRSRVRFSRNAKNSTSCCRSSAHSSPVAVRACAFIFSVPDHGLAAPPRQK
jgi:hypothetical protein